MNRREVMVGTGMWLSTALATDAVAVPRQDARELDAVTAARTVVAAYVAARDARDPTAIAAMFTTDADQLVSSGEWRRGRERVVEGTLASSARNAGQRTIEVDHARYVAPAVIVADGRYEIRGAANGEPRRMWSTFVIVGDAGEWKIAAIRNMLPAG